jgi:hypothetical protein
MNHHTIIPAVEAPDFELVHPLVDARKRFGVKRLAKELGHSNHSTVSVYLSRAARDPAMLTPPDWVLPLCRLTRRRPAEFRPDLYLPEWEMPKEGG